MPALNNDHIDLEIDGKNTRWTLRVLSTAATITSTMPSVTYIEGNVTRVLIFDPSSEFVPSTQQIDGVGLCQGFCAKSVQSNGIGLQVEFALPKHLPFLLIRATLVNQSDHRILQRHFSCLDGKGITFSADEYQKTDLAFFSNGWQSWSYSGVYPANQKAVISHLGAFQRPKLYDSETPVISKKGHYTSDLFGAVFDRTSRTGWLAGFLSQIEHFGHLQMRVAPSVSLQAKAAGDDAVVLPETSVSTDWLAISPLDLKQPDFFGEYLDVCARVNQVQVKAEMPGGWCSWYHYFTHIHPEIIRENLDRLAQMSNDLPLELVQIDDGFEKNIGDWLETKPFFGGEMGVLADQIRDQGKTPGLWLAPFIVSPAADIYKNHPEWLIRDQKGKPANAGWNWGRFCAGLDLTHPEVQDYIRKVIRTAVEDWGYSYLKLDFLYAAALPGKRYNPTHTRAKILRKGMELIREAAGPNTYLLGCGAPLGPCLGIVDGMRIGTDTAPDWEPKYMGIELLFPNDPDIPSAKNALQNTLSRHAMHRRWWHNDPDCLLLRPGTNLTLAEVQTYASIVALTGGLLLLSDDMSEVSQYRLKIAQAMLPELKQRPQIVDFADRLTPRLVKMNLKTAAGDWMLCSYTNWGDKPVIVEMDLSKVGISSGSWWVREFWSGETLQINQSTFDFQLAPHATGLFAIRKCALDTPAYVGSDLHISQGNELTAWTVNDGSLCFSLELNHHAQGIVDIYLPRPPKRIHSSDQDLTWHSQADQIYRVEVELDDTLDIQVTY